MSKKSKNILMLIVFLLCCYIFFLKKYFNKYFPNMTRNEFSFFIISALDGGAKGTANDMVLLFLKNCIIKPTFFGFIYFYLLEILGKIGRFCDKINKNYWKKFLFIVSIILVTYNVFRFVHWLNPNKKNDYSTFYEREYNLPEKKNITFPKNKKNLIVIHVESLEKTFENKTFFTNSLIPDIEKLESEGIQFSNYQNGFGTTFTEGSLIALFTGTPINPHLNLNHVGQFSSIFKNVYSLGKILKDNGYQTFSMQSTLGDYAGMKNFLSLHGIDDITDSKILKKTLLKDQIISHWGFGDKNLFFAVKDKIKNIDKSKPYFLYIQTVDTHVKYIPKDIKKNIYSNPYLNVIYNTNLAVADFIDWFKKQPEYKNTTIVILGDHLRMGKDFKMPQIRSIYNLFMNTSIVPNDTNRTFSQVDLFPSVLEAIGVKIINHKLGLGTSIFSENKTLAERFSEQELENELGKNNKIYDKLW